MAVLLVCTKGDLSPDPIAQAAEGSAAVGAEAIVLSAHDGWGVGALRARLAPRRTAALVGMSGVGKSTLVNLLLGEERQKTLAVREKDARGRHATTHRELFGPRAAASPTAATTASQAAACGPRSRRASSRRSGWRRCASSSAKG